MSARQHIRVVLRNRPGGAGGSAFEIGDDGQSISLRQMSGNSKTDRVSYRLDAVLADASQDRVFEEVGRPLCETLLQGYNATAMCYGQTGAGKSFTMIGDGHDYHQRGLLPRALSHIFREVESRPEFSYRIRFQCLEIYNENMYDLLSTLPGSERTDLSISERAGIVEVKGLSAPEIKSEEEGLRLLFEAEANRAVSQHQLNARSSRSHVLYMLTLERRSRVESSGEAGRIHAYPWPPPRPVRRLDFHNRHPPIALTKPLLTTTFIIADAGTVLKSRLTMVDLAGSERLKKASSQSGMNTTSGSPAAKEQLVREAMAINKSLTFLEQVVMALGSRSRAHVPHRSSRLTSVLRESLGGNCKTVLIANVRTEEMSLEETVSTLRFATRMSSVSTSASVNSEVQLSPEAELQKCYAQISELKRELAMHDQLANRSSVCYEPFSEQQKAEVRAQAKQYLTTDTGQLEVTSLRHANEIFAQFKELFREQEERFQRMRANTDGSGQDGGFQLSASIEPNPSVEVVYVGEEAAGSSGFGVGEAPPDARPAEGMMRVLRESSERFAETTAARDTAKSFGAGNSADALDAGTSIRSRAYAEFKMGEGRELADALAQNKAALREKKAEVKRLSHEVNSAKHAIDEYRELLERKREQRAGLPTSTEIDADGQPVDVIDEEEYGYLTQLKASKQSYRSAFDQLREAKSDAQYTQQVLENCQAQLLNDFDAWAQVEYPEAALNFGNEPEPDAAHQGDFEAPQRASGADVLDQDEEFEAMQSDRIIKQDPGSLAFMKAAKIAAARSNGRGNAMSSIRRRG